jgi:hypothetical protein
MNISVTWSNISSLSFRIHFQGNTSNFAVITAYLNDTNISYKIHRHTQDDTLIA